MSRVATRITSIQGQGQNGQHAKNANERMQDEKQGGPNQGVGQNQNDLGALSKKELSQN